MAPDWVRISFVKTMADQITLYSYTIPDACRQVGKAHKREFHEKRREAASQILELLEHGVAEANIAKELHVTIDYIRRIKWKSESEKRNNSFEKRLYEFSRHKDYQKIMGANQ